MSIISALVIGLIFGAGIALSGMINPAKVINFFDAAGTWDPSLAFVMVGALAVTMIGYRVVLRRPAPLLANEFHVPTSRRIDPPLVLGSAVFGIAWGATGVCPGGVIPALGLGNPAALVFVVSMAIGIGVVRLMQARR